MPRSDLPFGSEFTPTNMSLRKLEQLAQQLHCIQDMQAASETVDLVSLRKALEERNIHFPSGGKHPSIMKLWLEKAGVFTGAWRINISAVDSVLQTKAQEIEALAGLSPEQRSYLKALANAGGGGP